MIYQGGMSPGQQEVGEQKFDFNLLPATVQQTIRAVEDNTPARTALIQLAMAIGDSRQRLNQLKSEKRPTSLISGPLTDQDVSDSSQNVYQARDEVEKHLDDPQVAAAYQAINNWQTEIQR